MKFFLHAAVAVAFVGFVSSPLFAQAKKTLVVEAKLAAKEKNGAESVMTMPKAVVDPSTKSEFAVADGANNVKVVMNAGTTRTDGKHQIEVQMTEKGKDGKPTVLKFPKINVQTGKSATAALTSGNISYVFEVTVRPE